MPLFGYILLHCLLSVIELFIGYSRNEHTTSILSVYISSVGAAYGAPILLTFNTSQISLSLLHLPLLNHKVWCLVAASYL